MRNGPRAEGAGALHVQAVLEAEHHPADQACVTRPPDDAQGDDDGPLASAERGGKCKCQHEAREGQEQVDDAHQDIVDPPAGESGDDADENAYRGSYRDDENRHRQRRP